MAKSCTVDTVYTDGCRVKKSPLAATRVIETPVLQPLPCPINLVWTKVDLRDTNSVHASLVRRANTSPVTDSTQDAAHGLGDPAVTASSGS
jgi:hypothetical protein